MFSTFQTRLRRANLRRSRDWLPRLVRVGVRAVAGREVAADVLAYMRHLHDMQDCAAHVVPALRRLHRGPALKMAAFA